MLARLILGRARRPGGPSLALAAVCAAVPAAHAEEGSVVLAKQCQVCHATEASAPPRQGPNLAGIIGRPAGSQQGFTYSNGLNQPDFDWTPERLDAWLTDPQAMIPDSYMAYRQDDPEMRAKVIAYLAALKAP